MRRLICKIPDTQKSDLILKPITYPGVRPNTYVITNYGEVYTNRFKTKSIFNDKDGYHKVNLCCTDRSEERNMKGRDFHIHKMVAYEFIPEYARNEVINHIDCNKENSYYGNLEYCTDHENRQHAVKNGLMARGERSNFNVFSENTVRDICNMLQNGIISEEIRNNIRPLLPNCTRKQIADLVRNIRNRTSWRYVSNDYIF